MAMMVPTMAAPAGAVDGPAQIAPGQARIVQKVTEEGPGHGHQGDGGEGMSQGGEAMQSIAATPQHL
jgi:hypothetical protein